jgi:MSHA biogenesis protein MshO
MPRRRAQRGFTLVEMVTVIVLLGIIAGVLAPFITNAMQGYVDAKARALLVAKGRLALERLAREVRHAVPNSISVLSGGTGIEFLRARAGGRYVARFDNYGSAFANTTLRLRKNANMTGLYIVGTSLPISSGELLVIGNTSPADLLAGSPGPAVTLTAVATTNPAAWPAGDGTGAGQILTFGANHRFAAQSPGRHYTIADRTIEVGRTGSTLRWHTASGLTDYDGGVDWSAADPTLVDGVSAVTFTYAPGTPQATGVLRMDLLLSDGSGSESIRLYHEVHVRNTP